MKSDLVVGQAAVDVLQEVPVSPTRPGEGRTPAGLVVPLGPAELTEKEQRAIAAATKGAR